MLFSYALLFSLFATFVAAAPTTIPQPRIAPSHAFTVIEGFLRANGAEWTRVKSPESNSPANKIKWLLVERYSEHYGQKMKDLFVEVAGTKHDFSEGASIDKKTVSDLVGTWEREGTGSKIEIEKKEHPVIGFLNYKVLVEGIWEREKQTGLPSGWQAFEEHVDFLMAKSGVWAPVGEGKFGVQQIKFSERINDYTGLKELVSSYKTKSGISEEFPRWFPGRHAPDVQFGSTQWERKETGSKIEIVQRDESLGVYNYYFKMTAEGNWKGDSAKESQGSKSGGKSAH